jgi:hypothetical protein
MYSDFERSLDCVKCERRFDDPKMLPCANIICNRCVLVICHMVDQSETHFKCPLCKEQHHFPKNRIFPTCLPVLNFLKKLETTNKDESILPARSQDEKKELIFQQLKKNLEEIRTKMNLLTNDINTGIDKVIEHCNNLRTEIRLTTEITIDKINEMSEAMINKINTYQKECFKKYEKKGNYRLEKTKEIEQINDFLNKWDLFLREYEPDETQLTRANNLALGHKEKLEKEYQRLNEFLFDNRFQKITFSYLNLKFYIFFFIILIFI